MSDNRDEIGDWYDIGYGIYLLYYPSPGKSIVDAIELYNPDMVAVELDGRRYESFQQPYSINADDEIKPANELIMIAITEAQKKGIQLALIDRDQGITLARFWNMMPLNEKLKMIYSTGLGFIGLGEKEIDIAKIGHEAIASELVDDLRNYTPTVAAVIVDERDAFMAYNLLELSKTRRVVGVVGAGHRRGIRRYIENPDIIPPINILCKVK